LIPVSLLDQKPALFSGVPSSSVSVEIKLSMTEYRIGGHRGIPIDYLSEASLSTSKK